MADPVRVKPVNCGEFPVPRPKDVLAVDPDSKTYWVPSDTINDPSLCVSPDNVVRSESKACTSVPIWRPIPVLKAAKDA